MPKNSGGGAFKKFLFQNQSISQTIAKNTFWLSFGEITGRLLRVIIIFYAARVLGAAGYGTFSYMTNIAAIVTIFSDIGLSGVLVREAAKDEAKKGAYFSTSFALKLILLVASLVFILFGTDFITGIELSKTLIYTIGALFVFDSLRRFGSSIFRAEEKMELEALINIFTQVVIVAAGFVALIVHPEPESLALAYAIGAGVGFIATSYFLIPYIKALVSDFDGSLVKPIISAAWPMTLASVFGALLVNVDTVMIGWFFDATEVGYYAAAQKPIAFFYLLPAFVVGGLFPVLSRLAKENVDKFRSVMERGISMVMVMALPLAAGIFLTAESISALFYGSEYLASAAPLRILSLTLFITFPASIMIHAVFAHNRQKELVPLWLGGSILNIGLNFLLIPLMGIVGAAWASAATQFGINSMLWLKTKQISKFSVFGKLSSALKATLAMAAIVIALTINGTPFLIVLAGACATYLGCLVYFKDPTLNDLRQIISPKK